uniref:Uncharacterized protein n=1 Tax=Arundo donax TaxID=35708 RepID=A0A0A9DT62_ARUDO
MRSALQGWTCTLRGRGAQSTAAAGSVSLQPLPEEDSTNSLFIAPVGIFLVSILPPRPK